MSVLDTIYGAAQNVAGRVGSAVGTLASNAGRAITNVETEAVKTIAPTVTTVARAVTPYVSAASNIVSGATTQLNRAATNAPSAVVTAARQSAPNLVNTARIVTPFVTPPVISGPLSVAANALRMTARPPVSSNIPAPYISRPSADTSSLVKPFVSTLSNAARAPPNTVTAYTPYGNQAQTELKNVKLVYEPGGEVDFYQQSRPGSSLYNLASSGSRNALQSGAFTINAPETPVVYTQSGAGTALAKSANSSEATKIMTNPSSYSRLGAEVYGGYVTPLTGATVESSGAKLSTYSNPNNLARLVSPEAVNLPKSEMPDISAPWRIPSSAPAIQELSTSGMRTVNITGSVAAPARVSAAEQVRAVGQTAALPAPFKSTVVATVPSSQRVESSPVASVLEASLAASDALTNLPHSLSMGVIPSWTPGANLLKGMGLSGSQQLTNFQNQQSELEAAAPKYTALASKIQSNTDTLNTLTAGKINAKGEFTGTPEEYAKVQSLQSGIKSDVNTYNKYQSDRQSVLSQAEKSGVIIPSGNTYTIAPEAERPYGSFSDWSNSVQKLVTGYTPSQLEKYENIINAVPPSALPGASLGIGVLKSATNPQEALQSGVQGLALYAGTAGLGEGLGALSKSTGRVGTIAGGALKLGESPVVKYGVPALYGGAGVYSAAGGVEVGGPGLVAPKVGMGKFQSNLGSQAGNLLWMGAGALGPEGLSRASERLPSVSDIGNKIYTTRQSLSGVQNVGRNSGLAYDVNVKLGVPPESPTVFKPQVGSLTSLKETGIIPKPETGPTPTLESSALSNYLGRYYNNLVSEVKTAGFKPESPSMLSQIKAATEIERNRISKLSPIDRYNILNRINTETNIPTKLTPQKGSLNYLKEKGVVFSPPSALDITNLRRAESATEGIFNARTENKPTVTKNDALVPQPGSLNYLREKGVVFTPPSAMDILNLKRAEARTEGIFNARTEGGAAKPTTPVKLTPQPGSFNWLKEQGVTAKSEVGPVETPKARALSNYLGKYYEGLVKEVRGAGYSPESKDIIPQLRAATKVEELRLRKLSPLEQADILKNYDNIVNNPASQSIKLKPSVGSLTHLKETGVISPRETGPEITPAKQEMTDYLVRLRDNLVKEIKSAGLDPSSPQMKAQLDAEMALQRESIKKLNLLSQSDLFKGRRTLDDLLQTRSSLVTKSIKVGKNTWTNEQLANRLKPRRWTSPVKPEGVESGKGGQVLLQKVVQKAEQKVKAEQQLKKEVAQESKLEKKKKTVSVSEEVDRQFPVLYNAKNYDMANVESSGSYDLRPILAPKQPLAEMKMVSAKVVRPSAVSILSPARTAERQGSVVTGLSSVSDIVSKNAQKMASDLKLGSVTEQTPQRDILPLQAQVPSIASIQENALMPATAPVLFSTVLPTLDQIPEKLTQQETIKTPSLVWPPYGALLPGGGGGGGDHRRRFKKHEQLFEYNFRPDIAATVTAKALKAGSNIVFGQKSSLPMFGVASPKSKVVINQSPQKAAKVQQKVAVPRVVMPKFDVPTQKKVAPMKVSTSQFKIPSVKAGSNTGLKSMSLPSSLPTKKKNKK